MPQNGSRSKYQDTRRRIIETCRQTDSKTVWDCLLWKAGHEKAPARKPMVNRTIWGLVSLIEQAAHMDTGEIMHIPPETLDAPARKIWTWIDLNAEAAKRFKITGADNIIETISQLDPDIKIPFSYRPQQEAKP